MATRWAATLLLCAATAAAHPADTTTCAQKLDAALDQRDVDAAERLLKKGYASCGDGHGFLAAMAMTAASRGDLEAAVDLCVRELSQKDPSDRAVKMFLALYPRTNSAGRNKLTALGATAGAPLQLPQNPAAFAQLVDGVYCKDTQVVGVTDTYDPKTTTVHYRVECPRGTVTSRFVAYAERPASTQREARRSVDRAIESHELGPKFGVDTAAELRARVSRPLTADRSLAWLLGSVPDPLGVKETYALLFRKNPRDLGAALGLATVQYQLEEYESALKTLRVAAKAGAVNLDARAPSSPSALYSLQCRILLRQNKLAEATTACTRAIELGSRRNGPLAMAEILYLQGKYDDALVHAERSIEDVQNRRGIIVSALINQKLGRADAAKARFDASHGLSAALEASLDDKRTPTQWIALLDGFENRETAWELARCGHHYLDLGLPKESEACFTASTKLDRFPAKVARLEHVEETDPASALKATRALLAERRDLELLLLVARAQAHNGSPGDGVPALREALYKLAPWQWPEELVNTVCDKTPLAECMKLKPGARAEQE